MDFAAKKAELLERCNKLREDIQSVLHKPVGVVCPFCGDDDFDAVGLKNHLQSGHCEQYNETKSIAAQRGEGV